MQTKGLDIAIAVAAIASCALIAGEWMGSLAWSWSKFGYDLGMGMLVSIIFYLMLVRLPQAKHAAKLRRHILGRHQDLKRECIIQLLFASGHRSVDVTFWETLLAPPAFRDYFYADKRDRWYSAMNEVDYGEGGHFEAILKAIATFREELIFTLDQAELEERLFSSLRNLATQLGDLMKVQRGTEDIKFMFGSLQMLLGGWTGNGTVDYDPVEKMLKEIS